MAGKPYKTPAAIEFGGKNILEKLLAMLDEFVKSLASLFGSP